MPTPEHDTIAHLVATATALLASLTPSSADLHTVAAAARTASGAVFTGVNLYHFTGGPCAELVVLANAATANAVGDLTVMVAVGGAGGGAC